MEGIGFTLFFLLLPIAIIIVIVRVGLTLSKRKREAARQAADLLGLEFSEAAMPSGFADGLFAASTEAGEKTGPDDVGSKPNEGGAKTNGAVSGFFRTLLAASRPWWVHGTWKGINVEIFELVRGSGKNSSTYLVAKALYPRPLPYKLRATKEGFFTKLGKALFNLRDVQVGDPDFDPKVRLVSDDPDAAATFFGKTNIADAFLALIEAYPSSYANQNEVAREELNGRINPTVLTKVLDLLTDFARLVE